HEDALLVKHLYDVEQRADFVFQENGKLFDLRPFYFLGGPCFGGGHRGFLPVICRNRADKKWPARPPALRCGRSTARSRWGKIRPRLSAPPDRVRSERAGRSHRKSRPRFFSRRRWRRRKTNTGCRR